MNNQLVAKAKTFHVHLDTELVFQPGRVVETKETKYFVIQERELGYRFYLHQHPYVQPLVQRLLRKSTTGLQAADTEYSTRIRLANATSATDSFGKQVQLAAGELVYLADGAMATLDGSAVRFAGGKVLKLLDNSSVTPVANKAVTIPGESVVRRSNGAIVTTEADVTTTLVDGVPLPTLYSELFNAVQYNPSDLVQRPYPVKDLDFTTSGAYAV